MFGADLRLLLAGLCLLLAWDGSDLDMRVAQLFGGPQGFAWRDHWLLAGLMHSGGEAVGTGLVALLVIGVWWPPHFARHLTRSQRIWWLVTTVASALVVAPAPVAVGAARPSQVKVSARSSVDCSGASSAYRAVVAATSGAARCNSTALANGSALAASCCSAAAMPAG